MIFNSVTFLIFFVIVFTTYWLIPKKNFKWQNVLLLVASYVFYGWWDWRFLSLIARLCSWTTHSCFFFKKENVFTY